MGDVALAFPNIFRILKRYLDQLERFDDDEYLVLRHELRTAGEYESNLTLLETHLGTAEVKCKSFSQLISERKNLGTLVDEVNRTLIDKLAEIRAVVGLVQCGFEGISFERSPDFSASRDGKPFAVEVTRISASGGVREPPDNIEMTVLVQGDETDVLRLQLITKVLGKRDQLLKTGASNHMVWVSTGRDYFTVGRYEPKLAGLRAFMPKHLKTMVETAASDPRITDDYPELTYLAASPGRDSAPFLCEVSH